MTTLFLDNGGAEASVSLFGGQVLGFQAAGSPDPVLWMSPDAVFDESIPIRGGIPICWPWFNAHPTDPSKPNHGIARTSEWEVATQEDSKVVLRLIDSGEYPCELRQTITLLPDSLTVELTTENKGEKPITIGGALHSYFHVGDIADVEVSGLEKTPLSIDGHIDRIFPDTTDEVVIHDTSLARKIHITRSGSRTAVVWNPWKEIAATMRDFPDKGFREMVCVEAVNTGEDSRILQPGGSHTLGTTIRVASLASDT